MYDEELGFDPTVAYCINSCGRLAVGEQIVGVYPITDDNGTVVDFNEVAEMICYEATIGECTETLDSHKNIV